MLELPYAEADRIAKMVPFDLHMTLDKAIQINPELRQAYETDSRIRHMLDIARKNRRNAQKRIDARRRRGDIKESAR